VPIVPTGKLNFGSHSTAIKKISIWNIKERPTRTTEDPGYQPVKLDGAYMTKFLSGKAVDEITAQIAACLGNRRT